MKSTFLLLLFLTGIFSTSAQLTASYIDSVVQRSLEELPQAGVAVAVVKDGKLFYSNGYGVASLETGKKVNADTRFSIASNSKAFTTTALAMLVDEGKLNWTDRVIDHIPEFRMYDSYVTENFNIQDLVTHRSGLGLGAGDLMFIPDGSDFKVEDVLSSFQYQEPVSAFRTKYDYDNLLYITAGEVIHRITGMTWDAFVEQKIMTPLGMENSAGYLENLTSSANVARPHSSENGEVIQLNEYKDPNKLFGPAGGIYASVNDLSKWMLMHLNEGKYGENLENQLVSAKNHKEMWKAHTNLYFDANPQNPYKTHYRAYGLGWFLKDELGYTIVSHTGGMPGMLSQTVLIPELNAGIVVLTNAAPGGYSFISVVNEIKDALIGAADVDWIARTGAWIEQSEAEADSVVTAVWETCEKAKMKQSKPEDFIGVYEDDWFGKIRVEDRDGELWFVSERSPKLTGKMYYYQASTFAIKWEYREMNCDAFAIFSLDETGKAQRIQMKGISPAMDFSFDFQDLDLRRASE